MVTSLPTTVISLLLIVVYGNIWIGQLLRVIKVLYGIQWKYNYDDDTDTASFTLASW